MPLLALVLLAPAASAQPAPAAAVPAADSAAGRHPHKGWLYAGLAAAGTVAVFAVDEPVHRFLQQNRTPTLDALADGARQGGQWQFHIVLPVAVTLAGLVAGEPSVRNAGLDLALSTTVTAVAVTALKYGFGRERPLCVCGSLEFEPFGSGQSLPSGHTAAAFAAATTLSAHVRRQWMRVGLYGAATLVAWSRMNDDKHWLSDVAAGALLGITAGRLTRGRAGGRGHLRPVVARRAEWTSFGLSATF